MHVYRGTDGSGALSTVRALGRFPTERGGGKHINRRLAYVAVSLARYDARIYTNHKSQPDSNWTWTIVVVFEIVHDGTTGYGLGTPLFEHMEQISYGEQRETKNGARQVEVMADATLETPMHPREQMKSFGDMS